MMTLCCDSFQNQQDACNRFGEALGPILQEVRVDDKPEIYEAHSLVMAQRG
jgi:hypothetical protein